MSVLGNNPLAQYYAQNQGLPFGYEAVEYLESSGTQYIDTGYIPSLDTEAAIDIMISSTVSARYSAILYSGNSFNSSDTFGISWVKASEYMFCYFSSTYNIRLGPAHTLKAEDRLKIKIKKEEATVDNITTGKSYSAILGNTFVSGQRSLYILNGNTTTADLRYPVPAKLFSSNIKENNIYVRNFIPCVRKSDNKPGLYDLCRSICPLTNTPFYINAGTGEFVTP